MPLREEVYLNGSDRDATIKLRPRDHPIIESGILLLDEYLLGGFRKDSLLHFYGEPGAGKTTFAMQIMAHLIHQGWKGIWVDSNLAFSLDKFVGVLQDRADLKNLIVVQPKSFSQQTQVLQHLKLYLDQVGIIVVDAITYHYRTERFQEASQGYFQELIDGQLGTLIGIAHLQQIPSIVINYATVAQDGTRVPLVARGFERGERYRFYFDNLDHNEEERVKCLTVEFAPEKYSQNRVFTFEVGDLGIMEFQVKQEVDRE